MAEREGCKRLSTGRERDRLGLPTIPVLRYMKTYGLSHEQLAMVSVVQREWAGKNPRAIPGRPALAGRPGDADHRRGRAELADHRLRVPIAAVMPRHRWLRRTSNCRRSRWRSANGWRGGRLQYRARHRPLRQAAAQHQWRAASPVWILSQPTTECLPRHLVGPDRAAYLSLVRRQ
jgi:hypothetical protein